MQLEDERQVHSVPADRDQRRRVARVLGLRGSPEAGPTEAFDRALAAHRLRVRSAHERVWFRPLLESLSGAGPLGEAATAERLAAFGFADVERTRQAVAELTRGLTRSSRMMQQLLPLLLDWLSASPDPDLGLLGLRRLASGEARSRALASTFRDSPEAARHLALLLGTSRQLGDVLLANPDLIERLPDPSRLRTLEREDLVASARRVVGWRGDRDERQRALQRWKRRHLVGVAARDIFGHAGVDRVGADLTRLAEATLECASRRWTRRCRWRSFPSDVSVVRSSATPATSTWPSCMTGPTRPRPSGSRRCPPLRRRRHAGRADLADRRRPPARGSERPAVARSRGVGRLPHPLGVDVGTAGLPASAAVAGDAHLGAELVARLHAAAIEHPLTVDDEREVRRMKVRIEQERLGPNDDPEFHLKLGRGSLSDIEFTVQLLQLRHGLVEPSTMVALAALVEDGHLPVDEAEVLEESYRFCDGARNRTYLVAGSGDALPTRPELVTPVARSLGLTVSELRERYRRVTRRARRVVERRFYGQG